jgi:hypothetical protein
MSAAALPSTADVSTGYRHRRDVPEAEVERVLSNVRSAPIRAVHGT